jgi:hypothetical protein
MNAQFDLTVLPEEVVAVHTAGFRAAHAARVGRMRSTFAKQRKDDDRVRLRKAPRIPNGLERPKKVTDRHLVEKVMQERMRGQEEDVQLSGEQLMLLRGMTRAHSFG